MRLYFMTGLALAVGMSTAATAVPIIVYSYDTPNGSGQASGGTFNYWDKAYTGSGDTTLDGSALTGGTGDLTDGVAAPGVWSTTENVAGDGPYVGWLTSRTLNPLVSFSLLTYAEPGYFRVDRIDIHMDNSNFGGVRAPASILVNGQATTFTAPPVGTSGWSTLSGFTEVTSNGPVDIQFFHSTQWVFVSEVSFDGTWIATVPEPASWAMLIAGFGLVGGSLRRRRILDA